MSLSILTALAGSRFPLWAKLIQYRPFFQQTFPPRWASCPGRAHRTDKARSLSLRATRHTHSRDPAQSECLLPDGPVLSQALQAARL